MKKSRKEVAVLFNKAQALVDTGSAIGAACKAVGLSVNSYANRKRAQTKEAKSTRKRRAKLIVQDLPISDPPKRQLMLLVGDAHEVLSVMRGLE